MSDPLVSVVIPVYNSSHTIATTLVNLLTQTYKNFEIIVVNDGSDDTGKLERLLVKLGSAKIKYKIIDHGGVVKARMAGYREAKGELIAVQDADDLSLPDRLEKAVRYFKKNPTCDVYVHSLYVSLWDQEQQVLMRTKRTARKVSKESLLREQTVNGVPIFKRHVVEKKPLREETQHAYDWMTGLDWMYSGFNFGFEDIGLYEYVRRTNSLSERNEIDGKRAMALRKIKEIMKNEYNVDFQPKG